MSEQIPTANPDNPVPPLPPVQPAPPLYRPLTPSEERNWAMLAHLTNLLNIFTGFLGVLGALLIYLIYKDRSRYVAYQAMQSFLFQLIAWLAAGFVAAFLWVIGITLTIVIIGLLILPLAMLFSLVPIASLVYSVIAAVQTNEGKDFKYWLVGDWVRDIYNRL